MKFSTLTHTLLLPLALLTALEVTGLIAAARQVPEAPKGKVFLSGFSQGGHVTLAAMRQMEDDGEQLLGAAPVATAIDIRHLSLGIALNGNSPSDTLYLAYIARGFAAHYGHALDSVLTPASGLSTIMHRCLPPHRSYLIGCNR